MSSNSDELLETVIDSRVLVLLHMYLKNGVDLNFKLSPLSKEKVGAIGKDMVDLIDKHDLTTFAGYTVFVRTVFELLCTTAFANLSCAAILDSELKLVAAMMQTIKLRHLSIHGADKEDSLINFINEYKEQIGARK